MQPSDVIENEKPTERSIAALIPRNQSSLRAQQILKVTQRKTKRTEIIVFFLHISIFFGNVDQYAFSHVVMLFMCMYISFSNERD